MRSVLGPRSHTCRAKLEVILYTWGHPPAQVYHPRCKRITVPGWSAPRWCFRVSRPLVQQASHAVLCFHPTRDPLDVWLDIRHQGAPQRCLTSVYFPGLGLWSLRHPGPGCRATTHRTPLWRDAISGPSAASLLWDTRLRPIGSGSPRSTPSAVPHQSRGTGATRSNTTPSPHRRA
ncbi:hypothetical protein NDU88_000430 [Pleurodeles waltl]|uniref:Uncharacterized protein n=1 Tax=Pleurodeles waltl TaxID=8319 RepID=A0AAV7TFQ5_PLEWA|nr:hypothetical protein NDU88_000430 [Pleurodeles waltl]